MGQTTLSVTAPHATAYDDAYPTRSMENYAHQLHSMLQDMEDAVGNWFLTDGVVAEAADRTATMEYIHDLIEDVWDYAEGAIDTYRSLGTPTLLKPAYDDLTAPFNTKYPHINKIQYELYSKGMQIMFLIYYMWKTEEDPLLLKEKLQELLIAWPLTDTEIILNEEGGQSFHVVPAWKNVDL